MFPQIPVDLLMTMRDLLILIKFLSQNVDLVDESLAVKHIVIISELYLLCVHAGSGS
jgi:hypothetical protein